MDRLKRHSAKIVNGELRMNGWIADDDGTLMPILDILLALDAQDSVVERYIHPIGTPRQWERWLKIKETRKC